ncbi:MAG: hypothetical protein F6K47_32515 [Symploca sp. SIO2E6]|nr:hypothetical protein [Symploca sp. SIO2E6]
MFPSSSDNLPEQQYALAHFQKLLQKYPLAFWGGLWAILLLVGTVAGMGLVSPGYIEEQDPDSLPAPTQMEKSPKEKDWSLPLFSAVILGCAGGSLLVTKALRQSSQRRRFSKGQKSSAIVHQPKSLPDQKHGTPTKKLTQPAASVNTQSKSQPNIQLNIQQNIPPKSQPNIQLNIQQNIPPKSQPNNQPQIISHTQQTQVTVLSSEDNLPLDSKPEGLAEMMDLRKRQSLNTLMRGKSD